MTTFLSGIGVVIGFLVISYPVGRITRHFHVGPLGELDEGSPDVGIDVWSGAAWLVGIGIIGGIIYGLGYGVKQLF